MKKLLIFGLILAPAFSGSISAMEKKVEEKDKEEICQTEQQIKQVREKLFVCISTFNSDGILSIIGLTDSDVLYQALMLGSNKSWAIKRAHLIGATKIAQQLEGFIIYYENKHGLGK